MNNAEVWGLQNYDYRKYEEQFMEIYSIYYWWNTQRVKNCKKSYNLLREKYSTLIESNE